MIVRRGRLRLRVKLRRPPDAEVHSHAVPVVTVPITDLADSTPRSRLVSLDISHQSFTFQPGHAVMVGEHGQSERRPYSIACSPEQAAETQRIELLIAVEANGTLGPHLGSADAGYARRRRRTVRYVHAAAGAARRMAAVRGGRHRHRAAAFHAGSHAAAAPRAANLTALQCAARRRIRVRGRAAAARGEQDELNCTRR